MRRSVIVRCCALLAVFVFSVALASAQKVKVPAATGTLTGTVTDKHGTPLAGTEVTAKNLANQQSTSATTGPQGAFRIDNLFPAEYEITFNAKGFTSKTDKVKIKAGKTEKVHAKLLYIAPAS